MKTWQQIQKWRVSSDGNTIEVLLDGEWLAEEEVVFFKGMLGKMYPRAREWARRKSRGKNRLVIC